MANAKTTRFHEPVHSTAPYRPSWLNLLIRLVDRLPGPAWLYYSAASILFGTIILLTDWYTGEVATGKFSLPDFVYGFYPVYFVALMYYLDKQARIALRRFRPLLQLDEEELTKLEYKFTVVPALAGWIALVIAIPLAFLDVITSFQFGEGQIKGLIGLIMVSAISAITAAAFLLFSYHTLRQLGLVSKIHASAAEPNLFQSQPLYAFSELTARTGMGIIIFISMMILQDPLDPNQPVYFIFTIALLLVAVAAFILPLLGMHGRLVQEKARLEGAINRDLDALYKQYHNRLQNNDTTGLDELNKTLNSVLSFRGIITKLPTWPWQADTLRGFFSTLMLPVLIYILSRTIGRFLSL